MGTSFRAATAVLAVLASTAGAATAQSGQKNGYVQSSILLDQAPGRVAAEEQYKQDVDAAQAQIKRMSDSLQAMIASFERRQAGLAPAARESQAKGIQDTEAGYQFRARELEQRSNRRQNELVQPILDRIKVAIEEVRAEGGYSFIFNADPGSPIVALDKNLNVTDRVLAKLRRKP